MRLRLRSDTLILERPAPFLPFGMLSEGRRSTETFADAQAAALMQQAAAQRSALWGQTIGSAFGAAAIPDSTGAAGNLPAAPPRIAPELLAQRGDSARRPAGSGLLEQYADLGLQLQSRLESKLERNKNERCTSAEFLFPTSNCRGSFQPQFDFQFNVRTGGVVADRVHVNVDYDSEREFDASNNINVYYEGKQDEIIHRLEVGNVSFAPPSSRFITGGIPSGNYGLQATGQLGPMSFRTILAQQKGNVVKDRVFTIGDRTVQTLERDIEDYQVERRRFFWVVNPEVAFAGQYPNVDILDANKLADLALRIPAGQRPRQVLVYRYRPPSIAGSAARDINGPYAVVLGARQQTEIGPFEVLQERVDYYIDPTNLWITLVSPINRGERLAISYTVSAPDGREIRVGNIGGTFPTARGAAGADTVILLWDNEVLPGDPSFSREMRNVYRLGGEDIQRGSVALKIVLGTGNDQEQSQTGAGTYLQIFGMAQRTNSSAFDVENRLWPRLGDPNQAANATDAKLIRDYFVIFPSQRPFADPAFVRQPDPVNDSLYRTPDEDLSSQRRPATQYRLRARYQAEGGGDAGSLALGSVQVRANSERLSIGGSPLVRDVDYRVDYEQGRVTFLRPDTLFRRPQQVTVRYEENPLFAAAPTSIFGLAAEFPFTNGQLNFVAISQSQKTTFTRPPLGFEPASALVAGVNGNFSWESDILTRALDALPILETTAPSSVNVQGEFATSRPQPNAAGVAYVESFEGEAGVQVVLAEGAWRYGSLPATQGAGIPISGIPFQPDTASASTMAWQNSGITIDTNTTPPTSRVVQFFAEQIDPQITLSDGQGFRSPEPFLWLTLYPRTIGGLFCNSCDTSKFTWRTPPNPGRRWRSITQSLSTTGVDLSRVEQLEFWALVDTSSVNRRRNGTLVFDFGELSENSIAFAPETLFVKRDPTPSQLHSVDSLFTGRKLQGFDRVDTERDPVTRSFDAAVNDRGLPGDLAERLIRVDLDNNTSAEIVDVPICSGGNLTLQLIGDTKSNCTVANRRLDEEDLDLDNFLDIPSAARNSERLLRYVIDLSDEDSYNRIGGCFRSAADGSQEGGGVAKDGPICWVNVRVPFSAPTEMLNDPVLRRIKSVRISLISSLVAADSEFTAVPIARLKLIGSPWVKRADRAIAGIGGAREDGNGFVIASVIGTQDNDPTANLFYQSPPGVSDEADIKNTGLQAGTVQINEKSLRLVAGDVPLYSRAEAFYRFPEGEKNFMGYQELRVWARGRNKGWGPQGDLQFFIKIGRDQDNFYLYRTPVNSGDTRDAWLPEVVVDFQKFFALRARIQNNFLRNGATLECDALDSALIESSAPPAAAGGTRYAVCSDGYIVYTANPGISPPNLASVQELAVGLVRVSDAGLGDGGQISVNDSLEVWVDDIRLTGVVDDAGYAGQIALNVLAADVGSLQLNVTRRDRNFRQLAEQPTYITDSQFNLSSSLRLDRFLPHALGLVLPFTASYTSAGTDPFFLSRSDVRAGGIEGLRTPQSSGATYSLSARRAAPIRNTILGALFNNMGVSSSYSSASSKSEYQSGKSTAFSTSLDWNLASGARTVNSPQWLDRAVGRLPGFLRNSAIARGLTDAALRWTPAQMRFTSSYARNSDKRLTFTLPVALDSGDEGRRVTGLTSVMRNAALMELRPFQSLSIRWDVNSLRDLRDYGNTVRAGGAQNVNVVARAERDKLLGVDVGLERERQMGAAISAAPQISTWIKPRIDFSTQYSMFRDPNSPSLLQEADSSGPFRLPRRLSNSQGLGLSAAIDLGRGMSMYSSDSGFVRRLSRVFQPIEVSWRRDLSSSFDGVPFTPGFGYQFGLGGISDFRDESGVAATSASERHTFGVNNTLALPFGARLTNRYGRLNSTVWAKRLNTQAEIQQSTVTFPDVNLGWTLQPKLIRSFISSIGTNAAYRLEKSTTFQPSISDATGTETSDGGGLRGEITSKTYPVTASIVWAFAGGFSTTAGWRRTDRSELRSGGLTLGNQSELNGNVGKSFKLPQRFKAKADVRWTLGLVQSRTQSFFATDSTRKRVTDNGRWAVNTNADTDLSENMNFSMTLSRVANYDNLYDRRFTQMVLTASLQISFFAGELR